MLYCHYTSCMKFERTWFVLFQNTSLSDVTPQRHFLLWESLKESKFTNTKYSPTHIHTFPAEALSSWEPPLKYQKVSIGPIKVFCSPGWTSLVPSAYDPHAVPGLWTAFKCSLSLTSILTLCLWHQGPYFSSAWGLQCLPNLCHSCACLQPCVWILVLDPVDADPDLGKSLPWVLTAVLLK